MCKRIGVELIELSNKRFFFYECILLKGDLQGIQFIEFITFAILGTSILP